MGGLRKDGDGNRTWDSEEDEEDAKSTDVAASRCDKIDVGGFRCPKSCQEGEILFLAIQILIEAQF